MGRTVATPSSRRTIISGAAPIRRISSSVAGRSSLALTALLSLVSFTSISPRTVVKINPSRAPFSVGKTPMKKTALAVFAAGILRKAASSSMEVVPGVATCSSGNASSGSGSGLRMAATCRLAE